MNNFTFVKNFLLFVLTIFAVGSIQAQTTTAGLEVVSMTTCPDNNTVAVDVKTIDWEVITSMQFSMSWDSEVLEYVNYSTSNPIFDGIQFGTGSAPTGVITSSWFDPSPTLEGVTMDDEVTFTLHFNIVGELGDTTAFDFSGMPTLIEFTYADDGDLIEFDPVLTSGTVYLEVAEEASVIIEDEINEAADGSISLSVSGGTAPYTYMWSNGMTEATITNLEGGNYTCVVTDAMGCANEVGPYTVNSTVAVNNIESLNEFTLTPNPAINLVNVNVTFNQDETTIVNIYSLTGQVLFTETVNGQSFNLPVSLEGFSNGAYLLELSTQNGKAVEKLMVVK